MNKTDVASSRRRQKKAVRKKITHTNISKAIQAIHSIHFLGDLRRLEVRQGDRYVLMCPGHISQENASGLIKAWKAEFGRARLIVLDNGMKLGVIGAENP